MKKIKVEGFLDDIFSVLTDEPDLSSSSGTSPMNDLLKPHTARDLYDGVLIRLRSSAERSNKIKSLMAAFFPSNPKDSTMPNTIDTKLVDMYRDKMENVIVDFCTEDAMDIIKRTQEAYTKQGEDPDTITGDQYFGTILQQVHSGEYDMRDQLMKLYTEFQKEASKEKWQVPEGEGGNKNKQSNRQSNLEKTLSKIVDAVVSKADGLSADTILGFLDTDVGISSVADAIATMLQRRR